MVWIALQLKAAGSRSAQPLRITYCILATTFGFFGFLDGLLFSGGRASFVRPSRVALGKRCTRIIDVTFSSAYLLLWVSLVSQDADIHVFSI